MKTNRLTLIRGWAAALLLATALLMPQAVAAYDFMVGGLCYNKNGSNVTVTYQNSSNPRYSSLNGELVIPETIAYNGATYSVTAIDDYAFAGCSNLTSVTIPNSITKIGTYTSSSSTSYQRLPFYNCTSLKKVTIEDGSTTLKFSAGIYTSNAKGAFAYCPLEEVYIGRNISYIENSSYTFDAYPSRYGYSAFYGQSNLVKVTIGNNVTEILPYLFYSNASLTTTTLPHVKNIGKYAFASCTKLTTLNLGDAIVSIGDNAFSSCSRLTKLTLPNSTKSIGNSSFKDCSSITEVTTGNSLTTIGANAFYGCKSFTGLVLPNQFKTMGESAFENCTKLTIAQLGESITAIPAKAFKNCTSLAEMVIPGTALSIGDQAFYNDSGLATITMNEGLKTIGNEVFWNNSGIVRFTIPGSVTSIGTNSFYGCTSVNYLIFSDGDQELTITNTNCQSSIIDGLTTNSNYRKRYNDYFYDCPIRVLTLGRNLKFSYADSKSMYDVSGTSFVSVTRASAPFVDKKELRTVTIGPNVTYLYHHLFDGCSELSSLTIGANVIDIYTYACRNCDKLTSINSIENSQVNNIHASAFYDCDKLAGVNFPATLKLIDKQAFYSCDLLASTIFKEASGSTLSINQEAFRYCKALTDVTYPGQLVSLGESSYRDCSALHTTIFNSSTISTNKLTLNNYSFSGCSVLKTVRFPNHLYKINNYVYEKCTSLNELSFPPSLVSIGNYVFADSPSLKKITFENSNNQLTLGYGAANAEGKYDSSLPLFGNSELQSLYIGRNITYTADSEHGYSPFYKQSKLRDVKFSQTGTVTYCKDYLLYYVNNCQELVLPASLKTIGNYTFANMSILKGIVIPNNVTSVGIYAFSTDTALKNATLSTGCSWLQEGVFSNCTSLEGITIPPVVTKMDTKLFASCTSLATVTFESGSDIVEVAIGSSNANYGMFRDCPIVTLNLDRWLSYSAEKAYQAPFCSIKTLKYLNIGENVKVIDKYMFSWCSGLTDVYLPDNIESIAYGGFYQCTALSHVRFSQNLSQISDIAFQYCTSLDNVAFPESMTSVANLSFANCTSLKKLDLGNKLLIIGPAAFKDDISLERITIPETLYALGVEAFANCKSLPNVTIRSITSVGKQAFQNCTGLEWVSLSDKTTSLGEDSFSGCSGIKYVKSYAEFPPEGLVNFPDSVVAKGTLYVPYNSIGYYASSPTWENWFKIQQLITATSVSINKTEVSLIVNETEQLTATILPEDATDKTVIWASSDETISTVNNNGLVTAVAPGTATITATTIDGSNLTANCTITVNPAVIPATSIALNQTTAELNEGETLQLTATVLPENATDRTVTWTSSNTAVAAVDANGLVTAVAAGTVAITATTNDGSNLTANCEVTVNPAAILATSVSLDQSNVSLTEGMTLQLTATVLPENATDRTVTWTSSDPAVATVDATGLVTAVAAGTATITATTSDGSALAATCQVTVEASAANQLMVENYTVLRGHSLTLPVQLANTANNLTALQADIHLPEGIGIEMDGDEYVIDLESDRVARDHTLSSSRLASGAVRVLIASPTKKLFTGNSGDLFTISLLTSDEMSAGDYALTIDNIILSDNEATTYHAPDVTSTITVKDVEMGDVNGDGNVTVSDVVLTAQKAVGMSPDPFNEANADVNGDGNINVTDVVIIANIAVGAQAAPRRAPMLHDADMNRLTASELNIHAGESQTITLALDNATEFTAFQMQMTLPEGLTIEQARLSDRAGSHSLLVNNADGTTRLLGFSAGNDVIEGNDGVLVEVTLKAEGNFDAYSAVKLSDMVFVEPNGTAHQLDDLTLVNGIATGVEQVNTTARIYGHEGHIVIEAAESGLAQIVMANGMSRTVKVAAGRNVVPMPAGMYIVKMNNAVAKIKL